VFVLKRKSELQQQPPQRGRKRNWIKVLSFFFFFFFLFVSRFFGSNVVVVLVFALVFGVFVHEVRVHVGSGGVRCFR
jgi:hypothetical protein